MPPALLRTLLRVLAALGLLVVGAVTGLATVAVHGTAWGLALAVVTVLVVVVALPGGWWSRLPFALGLDLLVGAVVEPRDDGGYVLGSDASGYAVLGLALLVLVLAIATLPRPGRTPAPSSRPSRGVESSLRGS